MILFPNMYLFFFTLLAFCVFGVETASTDDGEARPRLDDGVQEARTTAVNWQGMSARKTQPEPPLKLEALPKVPKTALRVLIDAGHGGKDLGAMGMGAITEKNLCLRLTRMIKRELEREQKLKDLPLEIGLTRDTDEFFAPWERAKMANEWNADLFVSIHANYSDFAKARGFEVYFLSADSKDLSVRKLAKFENGGVLPQAVKSDVRSMLLEVQASHHISQSSQLAEKIFQSMSRRVRPNGRGIKQGPFSVLSNTIMPAVLVEIGYLSNPDEAVNFLNGHYLKRMANAISTGIVEYLLMIKKLG